MTKQRPLVVTKHNEHVLSTAFGYRCLLW